VGTIRDVKRSAGLADIARQAEVPILFVGNPYSKEDSEWQHFRRLIDNRFVMHKPHISDAAEMKRLYSNARGLVLFSKYENWSLVAHEAAACGLPLLLPDMKWSRECFGDAATYFQGDDAKRNAKILRGFCNAAPNLPLAQTGLFSWDDVAKRLIDVYKKILRSTRSGDVDLSA
jgi:glycosyltransferase involved in cell wall biosynthesis